MRTPPTEPVPPNRIRFIQFIRLDNGQTVLPFFSDPRQTAMAAAGKVATIAMAWRRIFELTVQPLCSTRTVIR